MADHAGIAIRNARLYAETECRRTTAEVLAEVGRLLSETLEPDVVGQRVADCVRALLGAHASTLYHLEPGSNRLLELASSGDAFPHGTGVVRGAIHARRPVVTPDLLADPGAAVSPDVGKALERSPVRAVLAMPLTIKDRVIGALAVADRTGRIFDAEAVGLTQTCADHAAVALENARLFGETDERLRETETLLSVARALSGTLPAEEAIRQVARAVGRAFGAHMVGAYFLDPEREALVPMAGYRVPKAILPTLLRTPFPLQRFPLLREAWETGRPVWTSDYVNDSRTDQGFLADMRPGAFLFAPTPVRGEIVGGLILAWWTPGRTFTPAELRLVEGVASQVGLAMENAELARQTREKLRETETLLSVSRALSSTLELAALLRHLLRQVARTTGADSVGVWLVDEATGALEPHTGYRVPSAVIERVRDYRIRLAESPFYAEGIASRRALVSTNVPGDPRIPASLKAIAPHRAQVFGPIVARDRVVGAFIAVWWERTPPFSERELALVEAMGSQAGVALENARLFQEHQRQLEELSVLYALSRAVTGQLDVDRLLQTVERELGRVLEARNMLVLLYDAARGEFEVALRRVDGAPDPNPVRRYRLGHGLMSRIVERRQAIRTTDYAAACRAEGVEPIKTSLAFRHWLGVPMVAGDEILGVLALRDTARPFTEADERLLTSIADVVGLALRGARLFAEKTRAHDELSTAQSQLICSEKLRALGEMAAGVAHDFNNVLAAIMGRAQLLLSHDEENVQQVLADALIAEGHSVTACADGRAGLARFDEEPFDVVFTDLGMPGLSGWDVARAVKLRRRETPVVLVTGWSDQIDPAEAQWRGVDFVMGKPFEVEEVRSVVNQALARVLERTDSV
jgi:GAF domain-containing protein